MSRFLPRDLSDAEHEHDGLRFLTFKSPALKGRGDVTLFVPPLGADAADLPLVLLLHGVYASHWAWAFKAGAHKTAARLIQQRQIRPMILAMPSDGLWGDGSGYVPHLHADYEKWIVEDVIDCVLECLPQLGVGSPVFISGLSMGGYGALRLGAKYPQRFRGISGHSSITHWDQMRLFARQDFSTYQVLFADEDDQSALSWMLRHRDRLPPLRFDCGTSDLLIEHNRALHRALEDSGIPHLYEEYEGGHTWAYWAEHVRDSLLFFDGCVA